MRLVGCSGSTSSEIILQLFCLYTLEAPFPVSCSVEYEAHEAEVKR